MTKHDRTFAEACAYGSASWCAMRLGISIDRFRRSRPALERDNGFPPVDSINGLTQKADVEAWLRKRRRLADAATVAAPETPRREIRFDNL